MSSFPDVLSETPRCTSLETHDITLTTIESFRTKLYPVPVHLQSDFEQEVDKLLEHGLTRPCSPVIMIKKSDLSYRMAIDNKTLNSVTVFDAEPPGTIRDITTSSLWHHRLGLVDLLLGCGD